MNNDYAPSEVDISTPLDHSFTWKVTLLKGETMTKNYGERQSGPR